jgi:hypothetical protein
LGILARQHKLIIFAKRRQKNFRYSLQIIAKAKQTFVFWLYAEESTLFDFLVGRDYYPDIINWLFL